MTTRYTSDPSRKSVDLTGFAFRPFYGQMAQGENDKA